MLRQRVLEAVSGVVVGLAEVADYAGRARQEDEEVELGAWVDGRRVQSLHPCRSTRDQASTYTATAADVAALERHLAAGA